MRVGSLFAGIGGLDLAVEWALGARTAWQLDLVGADVRRRHWPDALQVEADVADVDPLDLPPVDVLVGGFSCRDLSVAGKGRGIEGPATGPTYRGLLRFAAILQPQLVVIENVPVLLSRYRERVEADLGGLGYGGTWVRARALDAGAPHRRARVLLLIERGRSGWRVLDAPRGGAWRGDAMPWPTPVGRDYKQGQLPKRKGSPSLSVVAASPWPTPTTRDAVGAGNRPDMGERSSTTAALRSDRTSGTHPPGWGELGRRLSPDWVETLMGLPVGWTRPEGPSQHTEALSLIAYPRWPRGWWGPGGTWWPGHDWEPPRTLPDGPPTRGRPARLRALGNAVVPQQGALALLAGTGAAAAGRLAGAGRGSRRWPIGRLPAAFSDFAGFGA